MSNPANRQQSILQHIKPFLGLLILLCFILLAHPSSATTVVKVGIYNNSPTVFTDENQKPQGFFIDLLEYIARKEKWELQYQSGHFAEIFELLKEGKIDLMPAIAYSEGRSKFLQFTDTPLIANWAKLYTRSDLKITSLTELEGKKVVVKQGDIHFLALKEMVKDFHISCRFFEADGYEAVLEMVDHKAADIAVVNKLYADRIKDRFNLNVTPIIFNPIGMRFAAPKSADPEMIQILDNHLLKLKNRDSSVYYQALSKWFSVDSESKVPGWLFTALYTAIGCFLGLGFITAIFKYQINKSTRELKKLNTDLQNEIQDRKKVEEDLRKIARMVDASQDAMALIRKDNRHIFINNAYKEMIGETDSSTNYSSLKNLIDSEFFNKYLRSPIQNCLEGKVIQIITPPWIEHEDEGWWNVTFSPYYDQQEEISGFVVGIHDITEQMELENKLKIKHKMEAVGLLAGGVAHDLNNILSGIVSYPDMLLHNRDKNDPLTEPLNSIKKSGERAAVIVQDMLTMSRRGTSNFSTTNLNCIVREFLESPECKSITSQKDIKINTQLSDDLQNILGSEPHLVKIIMNLFTNAVEAIGDSGTVTLTTTNTTFPDEYKGFEIIPPGDYCAVSITDTGIGMTDTQKNRIFEPFYSKKILGRSGTGLGMAIVWGSMKDHNGFIDIQTEINHFTRFTLYFPATSVVQKEQRFTDIGEIHGDGEKILLVDDIEEQRELGEQILSLLGYSVDLATSGEEAVELCKTNKYQLLILDMIMPNGIDGLETYKQILQINPKQRAIIASGFAKSKKIQEAMSLGVGNYIQKPFSIEYMAQAIRTELNRKD